MSKPAATPEHTNFAYKNPGITASILTIIIAVAFVGLLYKAVTGGHG